MYNSMGVLHSFWPLSPIINNVGGTDAACIVTDWVFQDREKNKEKKKRKEAKKLFIFTKRKHLMTSTTQQQSDLCQTKIP